MKIRFKFILYCPRAEAYVSGNTASGPCDYIYSCFKCGCLTKEEKLTRQSRKLLWVMVVLGCFIKVQGVSAWWRETAKTRVFMLSPSLLLNHLETQSSKAKLLLPIIPINIVAYTSTLLWDNLCRNSCIHVYLPVFIDYALKVSVYPKIDNFAKF